MKYFFLIHLLLSPLFASTTALENDLFSEDFLQKRTLTSLHDETGHELQPEHLKKNDFIHIEGSRLQEGVFFEKALHLAKKANVFVSIDLQGAASIKKYRERILSLLSFHTAIVFANEEEALALTELEPEKAALFLNNFCKVAVVKTTQKGCWVSSNHTCFHSPSNIALTNEKGTYNHFATAFLSGYVKGYSLEKCAEFGNLAQASHSPAEIP